MWLGILALVWASPAGAVTWDDARLGVYYDPDDADDVEVRNAARAVVFFGNATGFVVSPDGHVVTNYHVYDGFGDEGTVWLHWVGQESPRALLIQLVVADEQQDMALYKAVGATDLPYIPIRTTSPVVGEEVFVVGHPESDPLRVSYGTVLEDHVTISGRPSVEYSAQTWWGSSGSPVVDRDGNAIALHWGWDSHGVSHGRLTGVPFDVMANAVPELGAVARRYGASAPRGEVVAECADPDNYSVRTALLEPAVTTNRSGRVLDRVEVVLESDQSRCEDVVSSVTWTLHPSFDNRYVTGSDRDGHPVTLRTWGSFDTVATVELVSGQVVSVPGRVAW